MKRTTAANAGFGDFQTPPELVALILETLGPVGERWPRVLEPTCGRGNFIAGLVSSDSPPGEIKGIELQEDHVATAREVGGLCPHPSFEILRANVFDLHLGRDLVWETSGPLLVIGNPPWVTNAELATLESDNLPVKSNVRRLRGLDALTGESNFDLGEHVIIKVLTELIHERPTIAMLCKTGVARSVLRFVGERSIPLEEASMRSIDARKWFRAQVDACLFRLRPAGSATVSLGCAARPARSRPCPDSGASNVSGVLRQGSLALESTSAWEAVMYRDLAARRPDSVLVFASGELTAKPAGSGFLLPAEEGCPLAWRQGIKHDAASVMELRSDGPLWGNRLGEPVDVEAEHVYPLLKGSDLFHGRVARPRLAVIVTQTRLADDTRVLGTAAPKLWAYLTAHAEVFARRKSSIYVGRPPFSLFGIGDYSFAPYKVAVAGLYPRPVFRAVGPVDGRPVLVDDTSYHVPCSTAEQAALIAAVLNHPLCLDFLDTIIFPSAKRPVTKRVLQRIPIGSIVDRVDPEDLSQRYRGELASLAAAVEEEDVREMCSSFTCPRLLTTQGPNEESIHRRHAEKKTKKNIRE